MTTRAERRPAWAEIDLGAIRDNVTLLREVAAPAEVCAVVKADGYGHGAVEVGRAALAAGATCLAVALAEEGVALRAAGVETPVLVLAEPSAAEAELIARHRLDCAVYSEEGVDRIAAASAGSETVRVHLKVDTGMHRVGAAPSSAVDVARRVEKTSGVELAGVWTHCAVADELASATTAAQLDRFEAVLEELAAAGIDPGLRHAANSAAAIAHPRSRYDLVRCGIAIYGVSPGPDLDGRLPLRPAMALKAQVSYVKRVPAGQGVSYGHRYRTARETTIATVPLGYADGVPRLLGARGGEVLVGGRRRPIAGTVTMDQLMVDCDDDAVRRGDEVVLIGEQGDERITAEDWAARVDTIGYEIVCGVGSRVARRYVG